MKHGYFSRFSAPRMKNRASLKKLVPQDTSVYTDLPAYRFSL